MIHTVSYRFDGRRWVYWARAPAQLFFGPPGHDVLRTTDGGVDTHWVVRHRYNHHTYGHAANASASYYYERYEGDD